MPFNADGEPLVRFHSAMPKGYVFVPKGNVYITKHCRSKTREAGKTVYVVIDANKRPIGLRVPIPIHQEVLRLHEETLEARQSLVAQKDDRLESKAREALLRSFPRIPKDSIQPVLEHTLKKHSGRVGRSTTLPIDQAIILAVHAHIRHIHTEYDKLWRHGGMDWREARERVQGKVNEVVREWGGTVRETASPPKTNAKRRPGSRNNEACNGRPKRLAGDDGKKKKNNNNNDHSRPRRLLPAQKRGDRRRKRTELKNKRGS